MTWVEIFRSLYNVSEVLITGALLFFFIAGARDLPELQRWRTHLLRTCALLFFFIAGARDLPELQRWRTHLLRTCALLAVFSLMGAAGALLSRAAELDPTTAWQLQGQGVQALLGTHIGAVWWIRTALAVPLCLALLLLSMRWLPLRSPFISICIGLALAGLAVATYAGHVSGVEPKWLGILLSAIHLFCVAGWTGALPAVAFLFFLASRRGNEALRSYAVAALTRFSAWAVVMTGLVMASGVGLAFLFLKGFPVWLAPSAGWTDLLHAILLLPLVALAWHLRWTLFPHPSGRVNAWAVAIISAVALLVMLAFLSAFPVLIGTRYGRLLSTKLMLLLGVFAIAGHLRWRVLPQLAAARADTSQLRRVGLWVAIEYAIGALIVVIGSVIAETNPPMHDEVAWPLPIRFSVGASSTDPTVQWCIYIGVALIVAGIVLGAAAWNSAWKIGAVHGPEMHRPSLRTLWASGFALVTGLLLSLASIAVPAFPDTYRQSDTPFEAVSVANGLALFMTHCTECHGASGRGDGPSAARLPKKPANLTEPHTALHTAGDMFWWMNYGIPASGMPGFHAKLSDEQRWDLVNFLRAFSTGYQARILADSVVPGAPWLGAPDFSFTSTDNPSGWLKEYRARHAVVLVFFSWPASRHRLQSLHDTYADIRARGGEVLAIPINAASAEAVRTGTLARYALPIVTEPSDDIVTAYGLYGRTLARMGDSAMGIMPDHMEFLIDRFGYIRARWIAEADHADWDPLPTQLGILQAEPQVLAFPDEHVH